MKSPDFSDSQIIQKLRRFSFDGYKNPHLVTSYKQGDAIPLRYKRSGTLLSVKYASLELGDVEYLGNGQFRAKRYIASVPTRDFETESDAVTWILEGNL